MLHSTPPALLQEDDELKKLEDEVNQISKSQEEDPEEGLY
jgi:hypothetical protein